MDNNDLKAEILRQLNIGKDKALTGALLKQRLGLRDTRAIRLAIINLIVEDGIAIVSNSKGYFLAETPEECKEALKKLRSYGVMLFRHYKYLKLAARKKFSGQMSMRL